MTISGKITTHCRHCTETELSFYAKAHIRELDDAMLLCPDCKDEWDGIVIHPDKLSIIHWEKGEPIIQYQEP